MPNKSLDWNCGSIDRYQQRRYLADLWICILVAVDQYQRHRLHKHLPAGFVATVDQYQQR